MHRRARLDQYVKTHLILVENMLKPLLGGSADDAGHVHAARLRSAPRDRCRPAGVSDALAIDQYVKTHTVLVENMIKPLVGSDLSSC